ALTGLPYFPEFLIPAPAGRRPSFADNVAQLRATPATAVRASLGRVFADGPWPASALDRAERPAESLAEIAAELTECYQRLVLPHWDRIASVLDADIAYRSGLLADGGARAQLGVTPSAVSQHLAALHRGGLIERQRSGRSVLYATTDLGLALLGASSSAIAGIRPAAR